MDLSHHSKDAHSISLWILIVSFHGYLYLVKVQFIVILQKTVIYGFKNIS